MVRKWILAAVLLGIGAAMITTGYSQSRRVALANEAPDWSKAIRLHVVANSDSAEDQELKREVRDALLQAITPLFVGLSSPEEARAAILKELPRLKQIAAAVLSARGKEYPIRTEFGYFDFPARAYGKALLPAGRYQALKVLIGEAKGANWWCVFFPPMCFVDWALGVVEEPEPGSDGARTVSKPRQLEFSDAQWYATAPVKGRLAILEWFRARRRE